MLDAEMREVPPRAVGKLWFKTAYPVRVLQRPRENGHGEFAQSDDEHSRRHRRSHGKPNSMGSDSSCTDFPARFC